MNRTDAKGLLQTAVANPEASFREGRWEAIDALVKGSFDHTPTAQLSGATEFKAGVSGSNEMVT